MAYTILLMASHPTNDPEKRSDEGPVLRNKVTKGQTRMQWYNYILQCLDGSYYTGITHHPLGRLEEHNSGTGSAWTRDRRPVQLMYVERLPNKAAARKRELELKGWRREIKEAIFDSETNVLTEFQGFITDYLSC